MKVDNTFDKTELKESLSTAYALPLQSITFFPEGEDSYGYVVASETGEKYFAKASTAVPKSRLQIASLLRHQCNISGIVAPLETQEGTLSVPWQDFRVSLFPFIEGKSRWDLWKVDKDFTDAELSQTAALLAAIHGCTDAVASNNLTVAKYDLPLRHELHRVLAAPGKIPPQNRYQKQLIEAITQHSSEILQVLERYDSLGRSASALQTLFVITHGDPTPGNLIIDAENRLHIIDWDGVCLGPPEKDLVSFTGERFEVVLESYLAERQNGAALHADIFGFYIYEWTLNEIRDYGTKILFKNSDTQQNAYDWESLQDYLPPDRKSMEDGIAAVRDILSRYSFLPKNSGG
ncbi:aminoglycoside phosphotransferase family protein [Candidatus Poribacteria bacterium]|nr:aminoglycoside phosphotransferase family protein [Candidatus Poribacteria bacterium]MYA99441.1 aminoglycoside phosphotransferase family protein [Candidatus Poribacteria bacterium]